MDTIDEVKKLDLVEFYKKPRESSFIKTKIRKFCWTVILISIFISRNYSQRNNYPIISNIAIFDKGAFHFINVYFADRNEQVKDPP